MIVRGSAALSDFRLTKLLDRLRAIVPQIAAVSTRYVHVVDLEHPLADERADLLRTLLHYGTRTAHLDAPVRTDVATDLWVMPRAGTISPWASKATDIAQVCGLKEVRRI